MPAPSGTGRTRVASLKAMPEHEIRRRRTIGEISCAECRRCRIRCDKKVPCGSCTRRGCVTVCPNKTLTAGKGARFVLSDTQDLHSRIVTMSQRIRQLEDALAITTNHSEPNHPLLADELLSIKFGPETREDSMLTESDEPQEEDHQHPEDLLQAMGTLGADSQGELRYFGASGGSNALLMAGDESVPAYLEEKDAVEPYSQFPFSVEDKSPKEVFDALEMALPLRPRAWALCQTYLEKYSWYFRPISREELMNDIMAPIYAQKELGLAPTLDLVQRRPHRLAAMLFIFAVAASMDTDLPAYSSESRKYYLMGKTALGLRPIFESPQMETVQAVALAAAFDCNSGMKNSSESAWASMALAMKLATRLGLHREPSKWGSHLPHIDRRRRLFWEIYSMDLAQCLALGRPQTISLAHVDCEFPEDEESSPGEAGQKQSDFWALKYKFSRDLFSHVLDHTIKAKSSSYQAILDLDQKIREMTPPATFKSGINVEDAAAYTQAQLMQHYVTSQYRFVSMLAIHRSSFASALLDNAANPLNTQFAPSVLAAHRCASLLIQSLTAQFEQCPEISARIAQPWSAGFSSVMVAGSIVLQTPTSAMASGSLTDLTAGVELFQKAAALRCRPASVALAFLLRLREKSQLAYTKVQNKDARTMYLDSQFNINPDEAKNGEQDDDEKDLATFAGYTKLVSSKQAAHVWARQDFPAAGSSDTQSFKPFQPSASTVTPYSPAISNAVPTFQAADGRMLQWLTPDVIQYPSVPMPADRTGFQNSEMSAMDMEYGGAILPESAEQWQSFLLGAGLLDAGLSSTTTDDRFYDQWRS